MLRRNKIKLVLKTAISLGLFAVVLFLARGIALAQTDLGLSQVDSTLAIATQTDIRVIIARIIEAVLGLIGIIMVGLIVYAGFLYMTAAGDPAKTATAKKIITQAIIGLLIILSSLAITEFVVRSLTSALFGGPGSGTGPTGVIDPLSGALGNGIIQDHYPSRDARDIPRNTKIIITFKEAIDPTGFIEDANSNGQIDTGEERINLNNIKVRKTADSKDSGPFVAAAVSFTSDKRTFVIRPDGPIGSSTDNVNYTVALGSGLKKVNGDPAFGGNFSTGYEWRFTSGTFIDETPPQISAVIPMDEQTFDRNVAIEITFDEPVDPLTVSGDNMAGFNNLSVTKSGTVAIPGLFSVSNGYKTVNFISKEACGVNSCGETIFCLPSNSRIENKIKAASLSATPPAASLPYPYDGVTDMAGNSLDGNKNGTADGPANDSFEWQFNTTGNVNLTAPRILKTTPESEGADRASNTEISAEFDKILLSASINNSNLILHAARPGKTEYDITATPWWTGAVSYLDANGNVTTSSAQISKSLARMPHGDLLKEVSYYPEMTAGVKDLYQNCFYPPESIAPAGACTASPAQPYCCAASACSHPCSVTETGVPYCKQ